MSKNVFVDANGSTICLNKLIACVPIINEKGFYTLYFDNGLTLNVEEKVAKGLNESLTWLPKGSIKK